tara:strand:+ start:87375 stop:87524 length:150 start_codon:yes stop_codon:yes gene_type:complete
MKQETKIYQVTPEGSLGVLAYGDEAFRVWRNVKKKAKEEAKKKGTYEEE